MTCADRFNRCVHGTFTACWHTVPFTGYTITTAAHQAETKADKLHGLTEPDSRLAHYFALFGGLGPRLGYLATSGVKSDVIFLLSDPDFARISRSFGDLTPDRQTDDRHGDRNRKLSHQVCEPKNNAKITASR